MSLIPKTILKGPVGRPGPIGPQGHPGIPPTDFELELIKMLDFIKDQYSITKNWDGKKSWTSEGSFGRINNESSISILHHYKNYVKKC